jgi:RHH-type proline utilization regulon transcriptional repressor/proline dehydrogenase/delta 1-pyrroline-5-carboxylate dehydrogenase
MLTMIRGAAAELRIGDPADPATHVGPVIDAEAKARLDAVIDRARAAGRLVWQADLPADAPAGLFVPPAIIRLDQPSELTEEVFGPILHVVTWKAGALPKLLDAIAANGTGLTLGIHSRIDALVEQVVDRLANGNVYVNRNMIGAVVGTQPFGGSGLSGTGPKAGGPHYLPRFALEQVVTVNTAAAGGNASLLAGGDE